MYEYSSDRQYLNNNISKYHNLDSKSKQALFLSFF